MTLGSGVMAPRDSPRSQLEEDAQRDLRIETSHIVHCRLSLPVCSEEPCSSSPLSLKFFLVASCSVSCLRTASTSAWERLQYGSTAAMLFPHPQR